MVPDFNKQSNESSDSQNSNESKVFVDFKMNKKKN
jgi:hypothetical protein